MADGSVKDQVREVVLENARSKGINQVSDEQSLMESGIIDSLAIFRLVAFLEDNFRVRISDDEIIPENFQSVDEIEKFVSGKLAKKGEAASTR